MPFEFELEHAEDKVRKGITFFLYLPVRTRRPFVAICFSDCPIPSSHIKQFINTRRVSYLIGNQNLAVKSIFSYLDHGNARYRDCTICLVFYLVFVVVFPVFSKQITHSFVIDFQKVGLHLVMPSLRL